MMAIISNVAWGVAFVGPLLVVGTVGYMRAGARTIGWSRTWDFLIVTGSAMAFFGLVAGAITAKLAQ